MGFRNFRSGVIVRVALLAAVITLASYLFYFGGLQATAWLFVAVAIVQIVFLIRYVERTNEDLTRFLDAVRHADFTQTFSDDRLGRSFSNLYRAFGEIMSDFRQTRAEKEGQSRYLQTVVQHIGVGLLAYDSAGNVQLMNTAARKLLRSHAIRHINQLDDLGPDFMDALQHRPQNDIRQVRVRLGDVWQQWSVSTTTFKLQERKITLASVQNIQQELDEKEMEAWQNLIRVLTHEINNSVAPIASLAATIDDMITSPQAGDTEDIRAALSTIRRRSDGLVHFVQSYRNLSHLPRPNLQIIAVAELFGSLERLMQNQAEQNKIHLDTQISPPGLELTADPELIEQVLINLVLNAIHALEGRHAPQIDLQAGIDARGSVWISVSDNGPGMSEHVQERIFIPFFTTKKKGSGIGLSLSRQILRLHGGTLTVKSAENIGTTFTMRF